ncbi:tyrosine-type recombinase/integrase [Roseovarius indicus]|uniref:Prophage CPS-53 integrase n=1 Tax=Roseovarius indicus TaxID=540747 RepID=A0A0T5P347_9RHOB|nr:site-specific integrase [Roseovarius indicus]KRS15478.1 hypothetical protein XM52_23955 [Roseovarius indicus]QEW28643.1 Putative prophage CPS-53 integrase [Roseovarius indicus]SFE65334.1 Site-specific recombinase XerD [Roseovarius indicus]
MPNITETYTKRADAPEKGNKIHYDDAIKGFGLRITKAGAKSFVLNYSINRRERRMTIGSYPAWTAAAAREEAKRLRRRIDQGEDPLEEQNQRRAAPNVSDLWSEYERVHLPTLSERSQTDQRSMWSKYILPELQSVQVRELSSNHVDRLHARVSAAGTTRANRVLEVFRKALNLAIRWGWIEKNPADGFRRNAEHSRERYLTPAEYERVFDALDRMQNQRAANAIRLLILTGARRGEVLPLEWNDLDLDQGLWNRPPHKSKDRKRKRIPLSNEALVLLKTMEENAISRYLFPTSTGTHMPDLNRPWTWLKKETGLHDLRVHDLRHSFASVLISGGVPLETIGKLLGHSQHQTTLRYAHLMDDPLRRAANSFSASSVNA